MHFLLNGERRGRKLLGGERRSRKVAERCVVDQSGYVSCVAEPRQSGQMEDNGAAPAPTAIQVRNFPRGPCRLLAPAPRKLSRYPEPASTGLTWISTKWRRVEPPAEGAFTSIEPSWPPAFFKLCRTPVRALEKLEDAVVTARLRKFDRQLVGEAERWRPAVRETEERLQD
jgi:hypothetical protein